MKVAIALALTFAVLGAGLGVLSYSSPATDGAPESGGTELAKPERKGGPVVKGLMLSLTADKAETVMKADGSNAEPVKLTATFTNVSDKPVKLDTHCLAYRCLRPRVRAPEAGWADEEIAAIDYLMPDAQASDYPELLPGKSWSFRCTFPGAYGVDRNFVVRRPGAFRLELTYTLKEAPGNKFAAGCWTGELVSDELVLKVKPYESADGFGPSVNGLAARVTLPRAKFAVGEGVPATYVVKNVSKEEQAVWDCGFWMNHRVLVNRADGREAPLTDLGKQRRAQFNPEGARKANKANVRVPLRPGEEAGEYPKYDLAEMYDLARQGRYAVQYVYQNEGPETAVPSNVAEFEIVPAGQAGGDGFGAPTNGLASRVTLPKEKFAVGEAVPVSYAEKNVSGEDRVVWDSSFFLNHMILVYDADGKEAPLTDEGRNLRNRFSPEGERARNIRRPLRPGEEFARYQKYDLTTLYDLSKPGRYSVQYAYQEGGPANRVTSNRARFEIVAR